MQDTATAHFASHVAGLRGQLLALMIGSDNLVWHHQVEADSQRRYAIVNTTRAALCLSAPYCQTALTATLFLIFSF